ncbi:MAG: hypothetical protein Q7S30_04265 [Candidatus Omnitrophota bacterium]|nr:hypothetical protein [Candidatus Omnitrophota bacterium]
MKKIFWLFIFITILSVLTSNSYAGIVLKVFAANPSKTEKQPVAVKAYLPKEIKPEDVVDRGDLEIAYDNQQGSYYVYGEYQLDPGQTLDRDVEMHDIWQVPAQEMESIRSEADKTSKLLENTDFRERMNFLKQSIDSKLKEIEARQSVPAVNPERHISNYRDNVKLLESVKADLVVLRSLLAQAKGLPATAVWRLILIIVSFLGVIGAGSYLIWQRQMKLVEIPAAEAKKKEETKADAEKGEKIEPKDDDLEAAENIEKLLREDKKE